MAPSKSADPFGATIDENTAISFIESKGYTCVKKDSFTDARLNLRAFYLSPTEISYWIHLCMGLVFVICMNRFLHLRAVLQQLQNNKSIKNKRK